MSYMTYISFPQKFAPHPLSEYEQREKSAGLYHYTCMNLRDVYVYWPFNSDIESSSCITFTDKYSASFKDCFINPFIYVLYQGVMPGYLERLHALFQTSDNEINAQEHTRKLTKKLNEECSAWMRQLLHDSLHHILSTGDFVEIYTVWFDGSDTKMDFGPPAIEHIITLDDVLTQTNLLELMNRHKLTISKK